MRTKILALLILLLTGCTKEKCDERHDQIIAAFESRVIAITDDWHNGTITAEQHRTKYNEYVDEANKSAKAYPACYQYWDEIPHW